MMRWFINSFDRPALHVRRNILFAAAGVISLSIIAYASIPDPNGVIQACYKRSNGSLRVIDPATAACDNSEVPIQWNQTGVPGPEGTQGLTGPQGPAGPAGVGGAKAMVYLTSGGSISRCYNGTTGSTTGNCGFSVTHTETGIYAVNFGFDLRSHFYSLTVDELIYDGAGTFVANPFQPADFAPTVLNFQITAAGFGFYDRPVWILVF